MSCMSYNFKNVFYILCAFINVLNIKCVVYIFLSADNSLFIAKQIL